MFLRDICLGDQTFLAVHHRRRMFTSPHNRSVAQSLLCPTDFRMRKARTENARSYAVSLTIEHKLLRWGHDGRLAVFRTALPNTAPFADRVESPREHVLLLAMIQSRWAVTKQSGEVASADRQGLSPELLGSSHGEHLIDTDSACTHGTETRTRMFDSCSVPAIQKSLNIHISSAYKKHRNFHKELEQFF